MRIKEELKIAEISIILEIIMVNLSHIGKYFKFIFDDSQNFAPKDRNGTKPTASNNLTTTFFDLICFDSFRRVASSLFVGAPIVN